MASEVYKMAHLAHHIVLSPEPLPTCSYSFKAVGNFLKSVNDMIAILTHVHGIPNYTYLTTPIIA